jgi:hypothetical protein
MNEQESKTTGRLFSYGNRNSELIDHAISESEDFLKQMAVMRDKEKVKKKEDFALVKEIMENKDELVSKVNEIIATESDKHLVTFLNNHKKYAEIVEEYIGVLIDTKIKLDNCITILEQTISSKHPVLEIYVSGQKIGKISDIMYTDTYDQTQNRHTLQFDLKNISKKIKNI